MIMLQGDGVAPEEVMNVEEENGGGVAAEGEVVEGEVVEGGDGGDDEELIELDDFEEVVDLSKIRIIRPSGRPDLLFDSRRAITLSLCIAPAVCFGLIYISPP